MTNQFLQLYGEQKYAEALDYITQQAPYFPEQAPTIICWRMCMLGRLGKPAEAVKLLDEALTAGYWYHEEALHAEADLASLQGMPQFEALVNRGAMMRKTAQAQSKPALTLLEPKGYPRPWPLLMFLHGNSGNSAAYAPYWEFAVSQGWLVALPQSSQTSWASGAFDWNDVECGLKEVKQHYAALGAQKLFDPGRTVISGFSAGGNIALTAALKDAGAWRGFVLIEGGLPELSELTPLVEACTNRQLRGYFIAGKENREYYDQDEALCGLMKARGFAVALEGAANTQHAFPPDYEAMLKRALDFVCVS
jgi:predicted esterase